MITASIVTYRHHFLDIEPVLRSLFASPVDTIYIIDHSVDIMPDLLQELEEFRARVFTGEPLLKEKVEKGLRMIYIPHKNNGYGGGHNVAINEAIKEGSTYHLVINPDIWFGPRVIPALLRYMDSHEDVAQMMPKVLFPNGQIQRLAKFLPTPLNIFGRAFLPPFLIKNMNDRFEMKHSGFTMTLNVPFLSGCFMFFRVSALKEINGFDERFFLYAEDIDITRRLHKKYKTLYYPDFPVYHKFSRASHHSIRLFFVHIINIIRYFNKWGWIYDKERKEINNRLERQILEGGIKD